MTDPATETPLARAQARSEAARARFAETIDALRRRATPQALAQDVAETVKTRGLAAFIGFTETAKRKPVAVGLAATLLGLFLARNRVGRLLRGRKRAGIRALPSHSPNEDLK